ncbi:hypothetical protein [Hymenobacter tenuis]
MPKALLLLFVSCSLLLSACKKNDPENLVLGRWNIVKEGRYIYDEHGTLLSTSFWPPSEFYMVITKDSVEYWGSTNYKISAFAYLKVTKNGFQRSADPEDYVKIAELSKDKMVTHSSRSTNLWTKEYSFIEYTWGR